MASLGLPMSLDVAGGRYSLLAPGKPVPRASVSGNPPQVVERELGHLLEALPPEWRGGVFSTLRSVDAHDGYEVQTLYAVRPDGRVEATERTMAVERAASAPAPRAGPSKTQVLGAAVAVLAALFATSFFVDYGALLRGLVSRVKPLRAEELSVETGPFGSHLSAKVVDTQDGGATAVLRLERGAGWRGREETLAALADASLPPAERLATEALASGYVRCELFDEEGEFLGVATVRVRSLEAKEAVEVRVPLPTSARPKRLVLVP
jgi:hypothetical protein